MSTISDISQITMMTMANAVAALGSDKEQNTPNPNYASRGLTSFMQIVPLGTKIILENTMPFPVKIVGSLLTAGIFALNLQNFPGASAIIKISNAATCAMYAVCAMVYMAPASAILCMVVNLASMVPTYRWVSAQVNPPAVRV